MTTITTTRPQPQHAPPGDSDITHIAETCCPPFERTLCGQSLAVQDQHVDLRTAAEVCVVCLDLDRCSHCPRCRKPLP